MLTMDTKQEDDPAAPENGSKSWFEKLTQNFLPLQNNKDLLSVIEDASNRQLIDGDAKEMIFGVINISTMHVRDIMIPRSQMLTINKSMPANEFLPLIINSSHTRIPVFDENKDDICGILHVKDILQFALDGSLDNKVILDEILRPAIFIPESMRLDSLLREFKNIHNHLAIVVDEYGSVAGLITFEDILEEIVGDIEDEFDEEQPNIKQITDNEYILEAITEIDEFNDFFNCNFPNNLADTIAGLIIQKLEHLPEVGEVITLANFSFTITEADNRRVHKLHVTVNEK